MIVKVGPICRPDNLREVSQLPVDMLTFDFTEGSRCRMPMAPSRSGIIPDRLTDKTRDAIATGLQSRVGVFADEMMQNVVTRVYNFRLDYVQLNGDFPLCYLDNLRATIVPDIRLSLKIIKTVRLESTADLIAAKQYEGHADMLLFVIANNKNSSECNPMHLLDLYDGTMPFIVCADFGADDYDSIKHISNPHFLGIEFGSSFDSSPGIKDVHAIRRFLDSIGR